MNKEQFIHKLKDVISCQNSLRHTMRKAYDLQDNLNTKVNQLLDMASEHYDRTDTTDSSST